MLKRVPLPTILHARSIVRIASRNPSPRRLALRRRSVDASASRRHSRVDAVEPPTTIGAPEVGITARHRARVSLSRAPSRPATARSRAANASSSTILARRVKFSNSSRASSSRRFASSSRAPRRSSRARAPRGASTRQGVRSHARRRTARDHGRAVFCRAPRRRSRHRSVVARAHGVWANSTTARIRGRGGRWVLRHIDARVVDRARRSSAAIERGARAKARARVAAREAPRRAREARGETRERRANHTVRETPERERRGKAARARYAGPSLVRTPLAVVER